MDGLLFDTERLYERAAIAAAVELGYELDQAFHRTTVGSPWEVIRGLLLDRYGAAFAAEDLRATARRIFGELLETEPLLKPGVWNFWTCSTGSACPGPLPPRRHAPRFSVTWKPTIWSAASTMSWRTAIMPATSLHPTRS